MRQPDNLDQHKCGCIGNRVGSQASSRAGLQALLCRAAPEFGASLCSVSTGQSGRFNRPVLRANAFHHRVPSEFGNWRSTLRAHIVTRKNYMQILHICCASVMAMKSPCLKNCPCCCGSSQPRTPQSPVWRLPDGAVALAYSPFCRRPRDQIRLWVLPSSSANRLA